jgi:hypothetical protein
MTAANLTSIFTFYQNPKLNHKIFPTLFFTFYVFTIYFLSDSIYSCFVSYVTTRIVSCVMCVLLMMYAIINPPS